MVMFRCCGKVSVKYISEGMPFMPFEVIGISWGRVQEQWGYRQQNWMYNQYKWECKQQKWDYKPNKNGDSNQQKTWWM